MNKVDVYGRPINIGDIITLSASGYKELRFGKVVGETACKVRYKHVYPSSKAPKLLREYAGESSGVLIEADRVLVIKSDVDFVDFNVKLKE